MGEQEKPAVEYEVIEEHRRCDAPDVTSHDGQCTFVVTHWAQPKGYSGPVYCRRHEHLAYRG